MQTQKSQLIQLASLHLYQIIRRLAMTYFLLSPKGIHGGESSLPKMRSILMMYRAEQCIAQLGDPAQRRVDIEISFREAYKHKSPSG